MVVGGNGHAPTVSAANRAISSSFEAFSNMEGPCGTDERQWTRRCGKRCARCDEASGSGDEPTLI
jgi:hypothetical protein